MGYLIGIDEAGYAPNLGPLVIAGTLWRVPGSPQRSVDLYEPLSEVICREPSKMRKPSEAIESSAPAARLAIADSKVLYSPQQGLRLLELGVLTLLRTAGVRPRDWRGFWQTLSRDEVDDCNRLPWHDGFNPRLPIVADRREIRERAAALKLCLRQARIRLIAMSAVAIFPDRFNALVEQHGSKGMALSHQSIALLCNLLDRCKRQPVLAIGDKHGGRNFYGRFLQERFPDHLVEIHGEGSQQSVYRFGPADRRVEVRFRVRGEEMLPVALASMLAKYFRELAMRAFNEFWCARVPQLKATAGYPGDAQRFKRQIEPLQIALGIDDHVIWRLR